MENGIYVIKPESFPTFINEFAILLNRLIHILPWKGVIEAQQNLREALKVADLSTGKMQTLVPPLSDREEEMFRNMMRRLHTIFKVQ
jgi:proline dehydrogenase